ncbi:type I-C CRISPR-associated protein Cas8c/Csd1 [Gordonibacter massiliensis (ex Traore et al. 2017)]|uniref:Type I-C CRISPR-associated protein Cas8c/Csd1 n=1 Tax=Gordonibacter massiliensis (ex Traore et al. 2017) TaxID=1841863 RepID=A0A842JH72_9ACTN|nr:type I-C CRISPR-associated protein Cas8c/Csd1 [Gordonibacter massiliensis (ex Traore et al. 2017)]MBC2890376.1 type I-C CRISPR-associated protein Cas8c/Csd1 [Gordonibacter massiliensis (ex Traore et al. 2017)]
MILQELNKYYERLLADPDCKVPARHWSEEKAAWELRLSADGRLLGAYPLTTGEGKDLRKFVSMRVPEHTTRSGTGMLPFFLCDNAAYLLGYDEKRGPEKLASARALHEEVLGDSEDEGARALLRFFEREDRDAGLDGAVRAEIVEGGGFAVFRLDGDRCRLHERPAVAAAWTAHCEARAAGEVVGRCSVTGEEGPLARLFPQVTGVPGAQSAGASLVSFNLQSFESYGKSQAYNASISESAAFNAGSALRQLCADPSHRVRIGETTVVFWTDRPAPVEEALLLSMFSPDELGSAEDQETVEKVHKALQNMELGLPLEDIDTETRYFVLGLAPNAARLAVRFFETDTLGRMAESFGAYLRDVSMADVRSRSLRTLLLQTAPMGASDQIPSTLVNGCMHAMLTGRAFPQALYYTVLSRMRSDHARRNSWDMGQRAALLKACLTRKARLGSEGSNERDGVANADDERGLTVYLDKERANRGYVLGRLFAIMEHTQRSALGEVNATIRDRYIGAASTTPARVFPHLLHNTQNHLSKLRKFNPGLCVKFEKANDEVMGMIDGPDLFPKTLDSEEQGEFFVGYYQQRVDLWTKHADDDEGEPADAEPAVEDN